MQHDESWATSPEVSGPLALLQRVTARMTVHHEIDEVLRAITGGLVQSVDAALARIWLYTSAASCPRCRELPAADPAGDAPSLHLCASAGMFDGDAGPHHCVPLGMFLGGRVAETREAMLLNDLASERRVRSLPWIAQAGLRAYAGYPLLFHGELEGVLGLFRVRPFDPGEFHVLGIFAAQAAIAIKNAALLEDAGRHHARLSEEKAYLEQEIQQERGSGEIVGRSPALRAVLRKLDQVASADTTVLLCGETGTGKELLARHVHVRSPRAAAPLIRVNCAAIAPGVFESELFGHERGAFTGALERRVGRFELAHGGTLFLDEIGELPLDIQVKLLRVLQEGEVERVGSGRPIPVDVRVVAATNRDLEADVAAGRFRADLFYRLNVFPVRVPPLRERPEDLPLLIDHFLAKLRRKLGKPLGLLAPESLERLRRYRWPGNVRELQNVLERSCVLASGEVVEVVDALRADAAPSAGAALRSLEEVEREHILLVLGSTHGVIQGAHGASRILGLHPNTLRSRMERLGILNPAPRRGK